MTTKSIITYWHIHSNWKKGKQKIEGSHACTTETKDIADPMSDGGLESFDFGLAEYAEGEAERAFST